jgi:hypothetical protein
MGDAFRVESLGCLVDQFYPVADEQALSSFIYRPTNHGRGYLRLSTPAGELKHHPLEALSKRSPDFIQRVRLVWSQFKFRGWFIHDTPYRARNSSNRSPRFRRMNRIFA